MKRKQSRVEQNGLALLCLLEYFGLWVRALVVFGPNLFWVPLARGFFFFVLVVGTEDGGNEGKGWHSGCKCCSKCKGQKGATGGALL